MISGPNLFCIKKSARIILYSRRLLDCNLSSVVTTFTTYSVVDIVSAAIRTYCQCWSFCLIVGSSLSRSGFGMFVFRMCHFSFTISCYLLFSLIRPIAGLFVGYPILQNQQRVLNPQNLLHSRLRLHHPGL